MGLNKFCLDTLFPGEEEITWKELVIKMIMLDNSRNIEGGTHNYSQCTAAHLKEIRKARNLPTPFSGKSFKINLQMNDQRKRINDNAFREQVNGAI